jgi:hypothetical protein
MNSLFTQPGMDSILKRLASLAAGSTRQWGKMTPSQALTHCSLVLETATGLNPVKQSFLGKIVTPFIRSTVLGDKPFSKNSPTDPKFVVSDAGEFEAERKRLVGLLGKFQQLGPEKVGQNEHSFFGKLTGDEWGRLQYKHIDHHLRQYGV